MSMMYNDLIELKPGYESVVKIDSDRDEMYWQNYIVNDDMVRGVKILHRSLKRSDPTSDTWHFILRGTYGTGKTYSALVIKHLLEDDIEKIEPFLKNPSFADVKDKFLGLRKPGKFVVSWKSGEAKKLNTTDKFLLDLESTVKKSLAAAGYTYTGRESLLESVKTKVAENEPTLRANFDHGDFSEFFGTYDSFDDFKVRIDAGDLSAYDEALEIFAQKSWGVATDFATFKAWLEDIFEGNEGLNKTGIMIIWDEFSDYIRGGNDLEILQELSQLSHIIPFYIMYVVHKLSADENDVTAGEMKKVGQRFHYIESALTEATTLKLISESILPRPAMLPQWHGVSEQLYESIRPIAHELMPDDADIVGSGVKGLMKQFPFHPMTINLMSKIAGIYSGSSRSVFKFLKDSDNIEKETGFLHYIRNNGPEGWKFVTPDYLWDYFFIKDTKDRQDMKLTIDAENCISHFGKNESRITNENQMRIFKAALLLKSTVDTGYSMRKSAYSGNKVLKATLSTIAQCFYGQLDKAVIETYLKALDEQKILLLTPDKGDLRIGLPYSGGDEFDVIMKETKENNPLSTLFDSANGDFGRALKAMISPDSKAISKRLEFETCWGATQQVNFKATNLMGSIGKNSHKFGILLIGVKDMGDISKLEATFTELQNKDTTGRFIICVLKTPLTEAELQYWYDYRTNETMATRGNNPDATKRAKDDAEAHVSTWIARAIGNNMTAYYKNNPTPVYNNSDLARVLEKIMFTVFPYAPETIVKTATLYRSGGAPVAFAGVIKDEETINQQLRNIVDVLKDSNVWEKESVVDFVLGGASKAETSIGQLVHFINAKMTSESTIYLDDLWKEIQEKFGYYDTMVCAYLLGFAMQFYVNKNYTWYDGTDSHQLDAKTMGTLIGQILCKGQGAGHKISSIDDITRQFLRITKDIFGLADSEIGSRDLAMKNLRPKVEKTGNPVWVMKYLSDSLYAGKKNEIVALVERYQSFVVAVGDQQAVVEDIVEIIKGSGAVYRGILKDAFRDKAALSNGLKNFITLKSPEVVMACEKYDFALADVLDTLRDNLKKEIWQCTEAEVLERLPLLLQDVHLAGIVNEILRTKNKTIEKTREVLANPFRFMKVPGAVYEGMNDPWCKSLKYLYEISQNNWVSYPLEKKIEVIIELQKNAETAWHNLVEPKFVISWYANKKLGYSLTDEEINAISAHQQLKPEPYSASEDGFRTKIIAIRDNLEYTKKVNKLKVLWEETTSTQTISQWCNSNNVSAVWLLKDFAETAQTLKQLEDSERIDMARIENAIMFFDKNNMTAFKDKTAIEKCFVDNVSSAKYFDILVLKFGALSTFLKENVSRDVYSWALMSKELSAATQRFIKINMKEEVITKAKQKIDSLSEKEIRDKIAQLMEENPDLCMMILKD
jgi:hypothetical protein